VLAAVSRRSLGVAVTVGVALGLVLFWVDDQIGERIGTVEIGIAFGPSQRFGDSGLPTTTSPPTTLAVVVDSTLALEVDQTTSSIPSTLTTTLSLPKDVDQAWRDEVLDLTNAERLREGLTPLISCTRLHVAAQVHSDAMHEQGFYDHVNPYTGADPGSRAADAGYNWYSIGENAYKSPQSPREAVRGWMNSPGHRANILGDYQHLGVGITLGGSGTYGDGDWYFWVQKFGSGGECD